MLIDGGQDEKVFFLFVTTILLLGCAVFPVVITPTASLMPTVAIPGTFEEPIDPAQAVKAGQGFGIVLSANPPTGYGWQITGALDASLVRSAGQNYISEQPVMCPARAGLMCGLLTLLRLGRQRSNSDISLHGIQRSRTILFLRLALNDFRLGSITSLIKKDSLFISNGLLDLLLRKTGLDTNFY
jgi:hypothetical protein